LVKMKDGDNVKIAEVKMCPRKVIKGPKREDREWQVISHWIIAKNLRTKLRREGR